MMQEELITDVEKQNHSYRHCRRKLLLITPITLTGFILKPKTQNQQAPDAASLPVGGMPTANAWPERLLSEKSGRCGIAAD